MQDKNVNITAITLQQLSCQLATQFQAGMQFPQQDLLPTWCIYTVGRCFVLDPSEVRQPSLLDPSLTQIVGSSGQAYSQQHNLSRPYRPANYPGEE